MTRILFFTAVLALYGCEKPDPMPRFEQSPYLALTGAQSQILSFNTKRLRRLSIYQDARDAVLRDGVRRKWMEDLAQALNLDPIGEIDQIVIGVHGEMVLDDPLLNSVMIFKGKFDDPEGMMTGFLAFSGERYLLEPPPFQQRDYQGQTVHFTSAATYGDMDKRISYNFAFPSPSLMIFSRNEAFLHGTLDVIAGRDEGISGNAQWGPRLRKTNLGAMLWSVGAVPRAVNLYLREQIDADPELAGQDGLLLAREYQLSISVGKEYLFEANLNCESIENAKRLSDALIASRESVIPKIFAAFMGEDDSRVQTWTELVGKPLITARVDTANLFLRMTRREVEDFVRRLTAPEPTPLPTQVPAPFRSQ